MLHPDPIHRLTVEDVFKKKFVKKCINRINNFKKHRMNMSTRISSKATLISASLEDDENSAENCNQVENNSSYSGCAAASADGGGGGTYYGYSDY